MVSLSNQGPKHKYAVRWFRKNQGKGDYCLIGQRMAELRWNFDFGSSLRIHEYVNSLDGRTKEGFFVVDLRFRRE